MPTYSYACTECDNRFDAVQAFTDDALTTCTKCEGRLRKLFSSVGVVFKGSGFYRTDSREASKASSSSSSSDSGSSSGDKSPSTGDKGSGSSDTKTSDSKKSDSKSSESSSGSKTSDSKSSGSGSKPATTAASN